MYNVYILKSLKTQRFYIGSTTDYDKRLLQHNAGNTKSTKPYRPWKLIYKESYATKKEAAKREWYLKHPPGYSEKLRILKSLGEVA